MYGNDTYPIQNSDNPLADGEGMQLRRDILRGLQLYWEYFKLGSDM